jgi:ApaG protein
MSKNDTEDRLYQIQIDVQTRYMMEQSSPEDDRYVFSYTITIRNQGDHPAQLLNRHWVITDAEGGVEEVRGRGVVGEQPYLQPGGQFQYTSGTILKTPVGSMEGSYGMVTDDGVQFEAVIPPFSLAVPQMLH